MSTYWNLHCLTCGQEADDRMNHGENTLAALLRALPHIVAALKEEDTGYLEFTLMGHRDIASFAIAHAGHDMQVISEYGQVYTEPSKGATT